MSDPLRTFTPAPGAASVMAMSLSQARMEALLILRNGEQLLIAIVIPVLVLVGAVQSGGRLGIEGSDRLVDVVTPGVLALAVLSTAFTSLAIATGFERRYGILKRLGASPLSRGALLSGKLSALLVVELAQFSVVSIAGLLMGWEPILSPSEFLGLIAAALVGTVAFASLGLLIAGALRAEATLATANIVYVLLLAGGAVVLPSYSYGTFGMLTQWLPSGALGESMRTALIDGDIAWRALSVMLAWGLVGSIATVRSFSWE